MSNVDTMHKILNGLDPALVEQASQHTKKRVTHPVRTALVAACLCVMLLGAAMAAEELLTGANVLKYFSGSEFSEVMREIDRGYQIIPGSKDGASGYVIPWEGSAVPLENMSEEVQKLIKSCEITGRVESIRFDSAAEMNSFMGVVLYENTVLDWLEQKALAENTAETLYDEQGNLQVIGNEVVGAVLRCTGYKSGMSRLDLLRFCGLNNGALEIVVTAEVVGYDLANSSGTAFVFADGTQFSEEIYETADGDKITILRCDVPAGEGCDAYTHYVAHFHACGVRYQVRVVCAEGMEEGGALMKEILDAFEFNELS